MGLICNAKDAGESCFLLSAIQYPQSVLTRRRLEQDGAKSCCC